MASPEQIQNFVDQQIQYVRQNQPEIERLVDQQREKEAQIIEQTQSFCPYDKLQDRTARAEDIEKALRDGYGDANVLKSLMCLNNSMISFPKSAGVGKNFKVRQYLQNLKQIGGESAEGYAMLADVKGQTQDGQNLFVVKAPRKIDPELRANQIHEYFVGAFGTNTLRNKVPNFAFILGFFQCSPPYIDHANYVTGNSSDQKKRSGLTYCQNDLSENEVNYLLYENVSNAKTLKDFIQEGASFSDYLNVMTQVTMALQVAYGEIDFTHYDLHTENVLVRELPQEIYIPYQVNGQTYYLRTRLVATIIDFGRSHIRYDGNSYGYSLIQFGVFPDRSYPMYDIYKLLMFSLADAAFGDQRMESYAGLSDQEIESRGMFANPEIFQMGKEMIWYFNPELDRDQMTQELIDGSNYLINTRRFYYSLPYREEFNIPPVKFYQDAISQAYPGVVSNFMTVDTPAPGLLYGCERKGVCQTLQKAISTYSMDDEDLISDPYLFYESLIEAENGQGDLTEVLSRGQSHYSNYLTQLMTDAQKYNSEYVQLSNSLRMMSLQDPRVDDQTRFSNSYLEDYRSYVAKSVKMVDLMTSIANIEMIIRKINSAYPNLSSERVPGQNYSYAEIPDQIFGEYRNESIPLNEIISNIKKDVGYIHQLNSKDILAYNPQAQWLFQKMPTLTSAIIQIQV